MNPFKVPGAEAHPIVFDVTPPVKILHFPEAQVVNDVLHDSVTALAVLINTDRDIQVVENVVSSERRVFFKATAPDNKPEMIELKELELDDLLGAIRKNKASDQSTLPDGKYEILVLEPGETGLRTVLEFEIVNGSINDGDESTRDQSPSSNESQQSDPDLNSFNDSSAPRNISVPENTDKLNGERDGASIDSTNKSQTQAIASLKPLPEADESLAAKSLLERVPRFGSKSGRIEWNHETDANLETYIGFATDQEPGVSGTNDSMDENSLSLGGVTNQAAGAIIFCSAASLTMTGISTLKNKTDAERDQVASPRLDRAARLLRKSVTFRGVSQ